MNILLVGERQDVLLVKYEMLEANWELKIQQCYSLEVALNKLSNTIFDCLIYIPFCCQDRRVQFAKLAQINQQYKISIRVLEEV